MARGKQVRASTTKIMWRDFNGEGLHFVTRSVNRVIRPGGKVERLFYSMHPLNDLLKESFQGMFAVFLYRRTEYRAS